VRDNSNRANNRDQRARERSRSHYKKKVESAHQRQFFTLKSDLGMTPRLSGDRIASGKGWVKDFCGRLSPSSRDFLEGR
jgi:hypothetical protein